MVSCDLLAVGWSCWWSLLVVVVGVVAVTLVVVVVVTDALSLLGDLYTFFRWSVGNHTKVSWYHCSIKA